MAVLDEFILQYSIKVKNAEALDKLQAKQKLFGNGAHTMVNNVGQTVNGVIEQLSKISPEADKVLGFLTKVTQRLSHLNDAKKQALSLSPLANPRNGSSPVSSTTGSSLKVNGPLVIHAQNAIITGKITNTMGAIADKNTLATTSVKEATAVASEGELAAGTGVAGALMQAFNPVTLAAAALATTFGLLSKMVGDFQQTWEQQFKLGNKLGLSTQQVESHQRSLVASSGGLLNADQASGLMGKIGNMGMNAASTFNVMSKENLLFREANVNPRDNKGDYIGSQQLLENLSDSFAKMTQERAQAIGQNMGLEYEEIEALRKNSQVMRTQHQLTNQEIILRQKAKETIVALKKAQSEMSQEWHRLGQLLSTYFTPIIDSLYIAFDKIITMTLKAINWLFIPAQKNPNQLSKTDKVLLERAKIEEEQSKKNIQLTVKNNQYLSLLTDAVNNLNTTLNSSNDYYASWAGEFNHRLNETNKNFFSNASPNTPPNTSAHEGTKTLGNTQYDGLIKASAQQYNVEPRTTKAIMYHESGLNPLAISKAGAIGLGQIMPNTARGYGINPQNLINPAVSIDLTTRYYKELLEHYHGNRILALMAYNGGPGNVDNWLKTGLFLNGKPMPKETRDYPSRVLRYQNNNLSFHPSTYPYRKRETDRKGYLLAEATSKYAAQTGLSIDQLNNGTGVSKYDLGQATAKTNFSNEKQLIQNREKGKALESAPRTLKRQNALQETKLMYWQLTNMGEMIKLVNHDFTNKAQINEPLRTVGLPDVRNILRPGNSLDGKGSSPVIHQNNTYNIHGVNDDQKITDKIKEHQHDANQKLAAWFGDGNIA